MPFNDDWTDYFDNVHALRRPQPEPPPTNGHHLDINHPLVAAALDKRLTELAAMPSKSGRNDALNKAAAYLGRFPIPRTELRDTLLDACRTNGLLTEDGHRACDATITSGFGKADRDGPRTLDDQPTNGHVTEPPPQSNGTNGRVITWTRGDQLETAVPVWAWAYNGRGRIQLGTLALLAGRPGAGKSTAARWFAAQATLGHLDGCWHDQPQHVAYIAAEESARYTIGPGLIAAGADMTRIHFPHVTHDGQNAQLLSILDEQALTEYCTGLGVTVVIVDPLMSTITATADINKNNEVRAQIQPWTRIADHINGITLGVVHLRKSGTGDVVAAVTGSSAFGELARSIFGFAKNPETDDRIMSQHKNSTGYEDLSVTYQIDSTAVVTATGETAEVGTFTITGDSDITVEDLLSDGMHQTGTGAECMRWLKDYLSVEGPVKSSTAKKEAHKEGFATRTVERAAKKLKVISESRDFPRSTYWSVGSPVAPTDPSQSRHSGAP